MLCRVLSAIVGVDAGTHHLCLFFGHVTLLLRIRTRKKTEETALHRRVFAVFLFRAKADWTIGGMDDRYF